MDEVIYRSILQKVEIWFEMMDWDVLSLWEED